MNRLKFIGLNISALIFLIGWSCTSSDYSRLVKTELAKGIRVDSVFSGIYLGDNRSQYEALCLRMNKEHLFTMGQMGSVQYLFVDSIFHEPPRDIRVLIDPSFDESQIISDVNLEFSYLGWAPWNRDLVADSLMVQVQKLLYVWYAGNAFILAHPGDKVVPVKVDGNRRILVYKKDDQSVLVKVQDLLHPWYNKSVKNEAREVDN